MLNLNKLTISYNHISNVTYRLFVFLNNAQNIINKLLFCQKDLPNINDISKNMEECKMAESEHEYDHNSTGKVESDGSLETSIYIFFEQVSLYIS